MKKVKEKQSCDCVPVGTVVTLTRLQNGSWAGTCLSGNIEVKATFPTPLGMIGNTLCQRWLARSKGLTVTKSPGIQQGGGWFGNREAQKEADDAFRQYQSRSAARKKRGNRPPVVQESSIVLVGKDYVPPTEEQRKIAPF